jgi:hypothetical protein
VEREAMLARIRSAAANAVVPPIPRDYRTHGEYAPGDPHLVGLFTERLPTTRPPSIPRPATGSPPP